jgi:hypothetical protein
MVPELEALSLAHRIQSKLERAGYFVSVGRSREGYIVDLLKVTKWTTIIRERARGRLTGSPGMSLLGRVRVIRGEAEAPAPKMCFEGCAESLVRRHAPGAAKIHA